MSDAGPWSFLFDLDHTLCDDHRLEESVLRDLARKHMSRIPPERELFAPLEEFRAGRAPLAEAFGNAFRGIMNLDPQEFAKQFRAECLRLVPKMVTAMRGAREMFETLMTRNVRTAVFSNGWTELQEAKAKKIRFPGKMITSEEIGANKPEASAFEKALDRLKFRKEKTLYVGDSPETDVAGAKQAGLSAAWFNSDGKRYPQGLVSPDFVISSLKELVTILDRLN